MSALDNYSPAAVSVVKIFAYSFHAAPTADIVLWGLGNYNAGMSQAQLLNTLYNLAVPQSPFTVYAGASTNTAFLSALVDNFCYGTDISAATKTAWANSLVSTLDGSASRGDFTLAIAAAVESYSGNDADLLTLKAAMAGRAEQAAAFAQSPAGAVWDGKGWAQLLAPLVPAPAPTYDLSTDVSAVDEGGTVTFTLHTTHVDAGTQFAYTLSGTGLTADDVLGLTGNPLSGVMTVNAQGVATASVTLRADQLTEGAETLRMDLANNLAHAQVTINDTSITPPPQATYKLTADATSHDEGTTVTYTLTTTNLAAGTLVNYTLSGTGITTADVASGVLSGTFITNAQGIATATVALVADALTEGNEVMRLSLAGGLGQLDVTINDTSITPPPVGSPDTVLVSDTMSNSNAHAPGSPAEGEIPFDTYLNFDLLNQAGVDDVRMSIAALKATKPTAGGVPDDTNQSADRANIPQVSNQTLFTFDLGLQTDRVDYSAESGKIVAVVSNQVPSDTQYVLVNDNGTDNVFNNATDRIDRLISVEEVVASAGGGVLDLTPSGQDWVVTFSRNFNPDTDIGTSTDRAVHRIELTDPASGAPYSRSYYEVRDGGKVAGVTQVTAAWSSVQGSDHNETLVFTGYESMDARTNVLRGGTNAVKFNDLTRSILVDISMTPWVPSTNLADNTNSTGQIVATTTFTTGDGITPLSGNTNVISSNTPDNGVASGMLKFAATQDAEDTVSFNSTTVPKVLVIGQTVNGNDYVSVRLGSASSPDAMQLSGFEYLKDNGATDDLYIADNIFKATQANPKLVDGGGNDHDAIRIGNEAQGSAAVGGAIGAVSLVALNTAAQGFAFDFDVLDLTAIDITSTLQLTGTAGTDDELVLGKLATVGQVTGFESLVLTNASTDKGNSLTLDLDNGLVKAGSTTLFAYAGSVISGGGLVFGTPGQTSLIAPMTSGMNITVVDSTAGAGATLWGGTAADLFTGGAGNDVFRGGGGNDTLDGGRPATGGFAETWTFTLAGALDNNALPANRISIAMTIDGKALTLTEAAAPDTDYSDGNGAVADGAPLATIGSAMAALITANIAGINAGPGTGVLTSATYNTTSNQLTLNFGAGIDANDVVTFVLTGNSDAGNFTLSSGVNVNGGSGGSDTFVFEKTAALNGTDTILNFTPASDKLDVKAFAGAPISAASPSINGAVGGTLAGVPTTAEFLYNKTQGSLSPSDFDTTAGPGKLLLADGGRCVVAVTMDPTGARGDAANTQVTLYFVENGAAPGLADLSVSLVGIISGPVELTMGDIYTALS
ncbi:beta strand repeat-containing protein [Aquabacterium sp.]|uniref:beta strand repeat-containing protein n=1 Tax=Aquabacterium sp. TaxID=1872578 RepID=UPI003783273C